MITNIISYAIYGLLTYCGFWLLVLPLVDRFTKNEDRKKDMADIEKYRTFLKNLNDKELLIEPFIQSYKEYRACWGCSFLLRSYHDQPFQEIQSRGLTKLYNKIKRKRWNKEEWETELKKAKQQLKL